MKYRNTKSNPRASLVIDDLASTRPWRPRGLKVYGSVDFVMRDGDVGEKEYMRLKPMRKHAWGLE